MSKPYIDALHGEPLTCLRRYPKKYFKPKSEEYKIRGSIMKDAFLTGYNPKEIAAYFKVDVSQIYASINVKELKKELKTAKLS